MKRRDVLKSLLGLTILVTASAAIAPEAQASWVSDGANAVGRGARRTGRAIGRGTRSVGRSIGRGTRRVGRQIFGRPRR
jgi:hypothetical protein